MTVGNFTAKGRKDGKFLFGVIIKNGIVTHATLKAKRWIGKHIERIRFWAAEEEIELEVQRYRGTEDKRGNQ